MSVRILAPTAIPHCGNEASLLLFLVYCYAKLVFVSRPESGRHGRNFWTRSRLSRRGVLPIRAWERLRDFGGDQLTSAAGACPSHGGRPGLPDATGSSSLTSKEREDCVRQTSKKRAVPTRLELSAHWTEAKRFVWQRKDEGTVFSCIPGSGTLISASHRVLNPHVERLRPHRAERRSSPGIPPRLRVSRPHFRAASRAASPRLPRLPEPHTQYRSPRTYDTPVLMSGR